jgi:hypothetical protein
MDHPGTREPMQVEPGGAEINLSWPADAIDEFLAKNGSTRADLVGLVRTGSRWIKSRKGTTDKPLTYITWPEEAVRKFRQDSADRAARRLEL